MHEFHFIIVFHQTGILINDNASVLIYEYRVNILFIDDNFNDISVVYTELTVIDCLI